LNITFSSVAEFGLGRTVALLNQAFADYIVRIGFTEEGLQQMVQADSVDLSSSLVVLLDGQAVGTALIARRGSASRLAAMALLPTARRCGAGRATMERWVADSRRRQERRLVLEVIEQNAPAMRLYEATGFARQQRLVGFAGPTPAGLARVPELAVTSQTEVAAAVSRMDIGEEWPWQISGETLARLPAPTRAYTLDGAWIILQNPAGPTVSIRVLAVTGPERREERAARLLQAVMAGHPAEAWRMPAIWPESLEGWFIRAGLAKQALTQWQMVRELD
jgi:ribosomal protein S18 acetylase RimI-like enzyme